MKYIKQPSLILLIAILFVSCKQWNEKDVASVSELETTSTYYLIRHAEKDRTDPSNRDPELTEAGLERADKWSVYFVDIPLDAIYSTNYKRTLQTAAPTAMQKGIEIQLYDPSLLYNEEFKVQTEGKTSLIVGHSNTTPAFVNAIIGEETYENMGDNDNSSLYKVAVTGETSKVEIITVN